MPARARAAAPAPGTPARARTRARASGTRRPAPPTARPRAARSSRASNVATRARGPSGRVPADTIMAIAVPYLGHGVGLRPTHYPAIVDDGRRADWFEVISENYMLRGG